MFAQHIFNTSLTWILYALIACSFYLATTSSRHFNFAVGIPFILMPHLVLMWPASLWILAFLCSLAICAFLGVIWKWFATLLIGRGSRENQLLIISLATLEIVENVIRLLFGSESVGLWPFEEKHLLGFHWISISQQQIVLISVGGITVIGLLVLWRWSLLGTAIRGLVDSRLGLQLRGYDVAFLETLGVASGFAIMGLVGALWAINTRVRSGMGLEIGVVGVATYILGPKIAHGLRGLVLASMGMAFLRLLITLIFEGDWSMTAILLLLGAGIALGSIKSLLGVHKSEA